MPGGAELLPNGYRATGLTLWQLIMYAYSQQAPMYWSQVKTQNLPDWANTEYYAVDARVASKDISVWKAQDNSNYVLLSAALRSALKERCKLALHIIPGEAQYYSIVVGKQGAKLNASVLGAETQTPSVELPFGGLMTITHHDGIQVRTFHAATMKSLAAALTMNSPSRPVQDKTGLTGRYDFSLQQRSSADQTDQMDDPGAALNRWPIGHLGLALKLDKGSSSTLVIDHIERPDKN
jgi:uncharacterized protein (TIGR03435 family)